MPSTRSRRSILASAATGALCGLAGCALSTPPNSSAPPDYRFSLDATMLTQPSPSRPPRFRVTLTNESSRSVVVAYGQELMYYAGRTSFPDGLRIVPATEDGSPQATYADGCWQYEEGAQVTILAVLNGATLGPGGATSTTFTVYDVPSTGGCYPAGEYTFESRPGVGDGGTLAIQLVVTITIDQSETISVRAEEPTVEARETARRDR